jgi:phage minor structural protein
MLKYIDKNGKKKPLIEYSNLCIEEVLDYGDKTLTCNVSMKCSVALEDIIRTRTNEYVIKQKNGLADDGTYTVTAKLNIDELEGTPFISFDTTEKTALEAAQLALAGTGWTCECDVKKKRTIRMTNASSWEILKKIVDTYMLEMQIDSINKVIRLKEKIGSYKGAYFTDQINLISLESQANTNDFYTRIYPIGKDGLTIKSVNNGSTVLENHIYSSKNKTYIWKDERYTDPQSLKEDAAEKLADMAQPYIAYSCSILDLSQNSKKYKNYNIGDEVVLIDSFSKTKIKQRIKKISRYPDDPSKDTCEIANLKLTFTEMQQKLNDAADTVNNITTDNGTVDGSSIDDMDANKLTNIDDVVSKTESFKSIKTEVLTVTGELQSASGKIGELETNKLDSETARITYATIENLKGLSGEFEQFKTNDFTAVTAKVNDLTVGVEKVKTLMFGSATGESITTDFANSVISMIGTAQIKDSMIDSLDAKKIKALDIDTTDVVSSGDVYSSKTV